MLARKAGYSPATLSESARGHRRPSLDVTLAYVGACGGDLDEWRRRWTELAGEDTAPEGKTPARAGAAPSGPEETTPPGEPVPAPVPTRRWARPLVLTAALVLVVAVSGAFVLTRHGSPEESSRHGCPRVKGKGLFTGQTYMFTRVRDAAALSARVVRTIPAGCTVAFSGFCIGDIVNDETAHTPDIRWFILPGGGVIASGVVHGNPPPASDLTSCPGNIAQPATIHLKVRRSGSGLTLQATGEGEQIVGFTSLSGGSGSPRWHQIHGLVTSTSSVFEIPWRPDPAAAPSPDRGITVAAVACLGGDGPTAVLDAENVRLDGSPIITPASLPPAALDAASRSACQYPRT